MKIEIKSKLQEPILERESVLADVEYENATPSRDTLKKELSKKLGVEEEFIVIEKVKTANGNKQATINIHVYKEPSKIAVIETKKYVKKKSRKEAKSEETKTEAKEGGQ